jgi:hypothetical protein
MTYNKLWLPIKVALVSALFCGAAQAVTLSATAVDLPDVVVGQDLWQFDYSLAGPLAQFNGLNLIYPFADFDTLTVVTAPASDVAFALTPTDAPSSADGLLTLTAQADLTSAYNTNFSVSFTKLTANALGPQTYELFDDTFAVIDTGSITIGSPSPVPEPSKAALLLLGAFAVAGAQWRRSRAV